MHVLNDFNSVGEAPLSYPIHFFMFVYSSSTSALWGLGKAPLSYPVCRKIVKYQKVNEIKKSIYFSARWSTLTFFDWLLSCVTVHLVCQMILIYIILMCNCLLCLLLILSSRWSTLTLYSLYLYILSGRCRGLKNVVQLKIEKHSLQNSLKWSKENFAFEENAVVWLL